MADNAGCTGTYVYVEGLTETLSTEDLMNYLEARTEQEPHPKVLRNNARGHALVTFMPAIDFSKLVQSVSRRPMQNISLHVHEVDPPRAVVVSSNADIEDPKVIRSYLENEKNGGGKITSKKTSQTPDGGYIFEFMDPKVVQRLCGNGDGHLTVKNMAVRISPYFTCKAGALWDTTLHEVLVPEPVHMPKPTYVIDFIKRFLGKELSSHLSARHGSLSFTQMEIVITCELKPGLEHNHSLAEKWRNDVEFAVTKFLQENMAERQVEVGAVVWANVMTFIQTDQFQKFIFQMEEANGYLIMVGRRTELPQAHEVLLKKIQELVRKTSMLKEKKHFQIEKLRILHQEGVFDKIFRKYGQDVVLDVHNDEVTVEGCQEEVDAAISDIYAACSSLEEEVFCHGKSQDWVDFVDMKQSCQFIRHELQTSGLIAEWKVDETTLTVVMAPGGNCQIAFNAILACICEDSVSPPGDMKMFDLESWNSLYSMLTREGNLAIHLHAGNYSSSYIKVIGTRLAVLDAVADVKRFIEENDKVVDVIQCNPVVLEFVQSFWSPGALASLEQDFSVKVKVRAEGISVMGGRQYIANACKEIRRQLNQMCSKEHLIDRKDVHSVIAGEKYKGTIKNIERETRCLIKLPREYDDSMLLTSSALEFNAGDVTPTDIHSSVQTKNGIQIAIVYGEIGKQTGDIFVCSTSNKGNLSSGNAGKSLLEHGGKQLQTDCTNRYPDGLKMGEVAVIGAGNLKCQEVYLTALPQWAGKEGDHGKTMSRFMKKCMKQAGKHSKKSIIFSAMGSSGYMGYPKDQIAHLMYQAVIEFDNQYPRTSLETVKFTVHESDFELVTAFREEEKWYQFGGRKLSGGLSCSAGKVRIQMKVGDLEKENVDAILCSVSSNLNLSNSGVCSTLLKVGGQSLQEECNSNYGDGIQEGQVICIKGGNLKCKAVFLTVLPPHSAFSQQTLTSIIEKCLHMCSRNGYSSLAVPALGMGYLKYPKRRTATAMYLSVIDWALKNPRSSVSSVRFVLYSKDVETHKAFHWGHAQAEARVSRQSRNLVVKETVGKQDGSSKVQITDTGCKIGSIELQVAVGDILQQNTDGIVNGVGSKFEMFGSVAKALKSKCPTLVADCKSKLPALQQYGVAVTRCQGLPAGHVVHVQFQSSLTEWRDKMLVCLQEAEKVRMSSLAFPVLGVGSGSVTYKPEDIAESLLKAIVSFEMSHPASCLHEIRLVIFHGNKGMEKPVRDAIRNKAVADQAALLSSHQSVRQLQEECSHLKLTIHSDTDVNITKCIQAIEDMLDRIYIKHVIRDYVDTLKKMKEAEVAVLLEVTSMVDIFYVREQRFIEIYGSKKNVLSAEDEIQQRLRRHEKQMHDLTQAKDLYSQVRWHYREVTAEKMNDVPYDEINNFYIEQSYKRGENQHELKDTEGNIFVIDFKKNEEYSISDPSNSVQVIRKDILKDAAAKFPRNWTKMADDQNMSIVTLPSSSEDYQIVTKAFLHQIKTGPYKDKCSGNIQVLKVERIQNCFLYRQYTARKRLLETQKTKLPSHLPIERELWHGTGPGAITSIKENGFNRSYCGKHGVWFGQGSYFARCASYSAQSYLTGQQQSRYMFQAKVLTGEICKGNKHMRFLPQSQKYPGLLYDSAVDDEQNPMEFVTFHDTQAYPAFLIEYM